MLFNSISFLLFFPIVIAIYFCITSKYRWVLLLAASYFFYGSWKVEYLGLIILSTLIDYQAAIQIDRHERRPSKKYWLIISLVANLGMLMVFKYLGFFSETINAILSESMQFKVYQMLLPVGISFYTFQSMSYTIDVYNGTRKPEKHLGIFALYVSFFPQLVAGPIERSTHLIPQFFVHHKFEKERLILGLKQIIRGFFKKVVVADRLSIYVDTIYNNYEQHSGASLALATVFFAVQIYCDFSGYSDIAIGSAKMMGYDLMENFKRPYFSKSIREFWSRWHISLSTWFRDYLYIPLGGNRVVKWKVYYNLMLVFVVSGFWHGANWTFIVWGFLHGLYLIIGMKVKDKAKGLFKLLNKSILGELLQVAIVFILVCLAWIFFRSPTIDVALEICKKAIALEGSIYFGGQSNLVYSLLACSIVFLVEFKNQYLGKNLLINRLQIRGQLKYSLIVILILLFGVFDEGQFIYFQF